MDVNKLISQLTWFNLVERVKRIFKDLIGRIEDLEGEPSGLPEAPLNGFQYARQNGAWTTVVIPSSVASVSGDSVDNTDPQNPIINDSRPYKVYTALLNQTATGAPSATVLENTFGENLFWVYVSTGRYMIMASNPVFLNNKTFCLATNSENTGTYADIIEANRFSDTQVVVSVTDSNTGLPKDTGMSGANFELRAYN